MSELEAGLMAKVVEWKSEAKRIYDLAQKECSKSGRESLMAQSVRYWNCADELKELLEQSGGGTLEKRQSMVRQPTVTA